ncbi:class I SAM-dependent methyltransferase [Pedobacter sp. Leaf132]|nr:class I SAM-dependent methyltransferase [Pedobacter sp. Leaf132]
MESIQNIYGNIDIYLFDQLMKGTYANCQRILDAGCGSGKNIEFFLRSGCDVYAIDNNPDAIESVKQLALSLSRQSLKNHFLIGDVALMPFKENFFDLVISSAVLHFANNQQHFETMLSAMWKVLRKGGFLFVRLASDIGIESLVQPIGNGRYILPDESERFLVNQDMLLKLTKTLGGVLHEPIKTTNVQNLRCMTTWCVQKL